MDLSLAEISAGERADVAPGISYTEDASSTGGAFGTFRRLSCQDSHSTKAVSPAGEASLHRHISNRRCLTWNIPGWEQSEFLLNTISAVFRLQFVIHV